MGKGKGAGIGRRKAIEIRRRKARAPRPAIVGVTWYRREDYDRLKAMFPDGDKLPKTFDDWTKTATEGSAVLKAEGFLLQKVLLDPETFPQWCRERGLEMTGPTRTQYAMEMVGGPPVPLPGDSG